MQFALCYLIAVAATLASGSVNAEPVSYLSVAAGRPGIFDEGVENPEAVKLEYRFKSRWSWGLAPGIGIVKSGNGAHFVFAAIEKDFPLNERWIVAPSFGLGSFNNGRDLKLGNVLEFRSGVKTYYQFHNKLRLGIELFHLSNAGVAERNPGTEVAFLSLSFPL